MNKPETERQEEKSLLELYKKEVLETLNNERGRFKDVDDVKDYFSSCLNAVERMARKYAPPGKTAVTFYIPEGMTIGKAIIQSLYLGRECELKDWERYVENELEEFLHEMETLTDKQIQEAIDNTFQEKDD